MIHWIFKKGFRYNKTRSLPGKQKWKFAGQKKQCIDCKESFYRSGFYTTQQKLKDGSHRPYTFARCKDCYGQYIKVRKWKLTLSKNFASI